MYHSKAERNNLARSQSIQLLQEAATPQGFLASPQEETNYRRVWARDGVICGLAGLTTGETTLRKSFVATIETLAANQGPEGQIPSNVMLGEDGKAAEISYGGLCGRVDTVTWFLIGYATLGLTGESKEWISRWKPVAQKCLSLLNAWEFNGRGLVYVPMSGHWADEYILHGYVLYDQLLRLWAMRLLNQLIPELNLNSDGLANKLEANFDLNSEPEESLLYHEYARKRTISDAGKLPYWMAAFSPGGYQTNFDLTAQALALGLGLVQQHRIDPLVRFVENLRADKPFHLAPVFWPVLFPGDSGYEYLVGNHKYHFRNEPYSFQNGGLWPVFNGWWGAALVRAGQMREANELLDGMTEAVLAEKSGTNFLEFMNGKTGEPGGTPRLAWSAAGWLLLDAALHENLPLGW